MDSAFSVADLSAADISAIWLTIKLATVVTLILLLIGTPVAWWVARTRCWWKGPVGAVVALPIVLPPTVIGFYLLVAMGLHGPFGQLTQSLGLGVLPFTFAGLVIASVIYSMPFVVQPLQNAFEYIPERTLETAATLRAPALDVFFSVALPLAKPGLLTASVLGFAHTVGEFGVVLMIGGNIPDQTRVVSVQIYDHVEAMKYAQAHWLSAAMLVFSFVVLLLLYIFNPTGQRLRHVTDKTTSHSDRRANNIRQAAGYGEASRLWELPPSRPSRINVLINTLLGRRK